MLRVATVYQVSQSDRRITDSGKEGYSDRITALAGKDFGLPTY
jgi:hypothetical protein